VKWFILAGFLLPVGATELKVPLIPGSFEARVNVRINGQTVNFLVDTGASRSAITVTTLKKLGLDDLPPEYSRVRVADGRTVTTQVVRLQNLELGAFTIPFVAATVAAENLLGVDVLGRYRFILDAGANQLTFQDPASGPLSEREQTSFPYNPRRQSIPVQVTVNGTPVNLLLDTGATQTTLSQRIVSALALPVVGTGRNTVADGRTVDAQIVRVATLAFGDLAVNNLAVSVITGAIGEQGRDGLLGYNFLRHFKVILDPATGRGYLQR